MGLEERGLSTGVIVAIVAVLVVVIVGAAAVVLINGGAAVEETGIEPVPDSTPHSDTAGFSAANLSNNIWMPPSNLSTLKNHGIKYIFVDIGDVDKETGLIITPDSEIQSFMDAVRSFEQTNDYDFKVLPWNVVIPMEGYNFDSASFRQNYVDEYVRLVDQFGFDGIHVDIEAIPFERRQDYLNILEEWRARLPSDALITVYAGSLVNETGNIWEWNNEFFHAVSDRVDIISIQNYDTGISDETEYRDYLRTQMDRICTQDWGSLFMYTVPTHKEFPEVIGIALDEYKKAMARYPNAPFVGIEIFAEWTISGSEWAIFDEYLNQIQA